MTPSQQMKSAAAWTSGLALLTVLLGAFRVAGASEARGAWKEQFEAGRACQKEQVTTGCNPLLYLDRALAIAEREHASPLDIARILDSRIWLILDWNAAEHDLARAIRLVTDAVGKDSPEQLYLLEDLAKVRSLQGNFEQEGNILGLCLQIREKAFGAESVPAAKGMLLLAKFYREREQPQKAENLLCRALAIAEKTRDHETLLYSYAMLGAFLRDHGRTEEAIAYDQKYLALVSKVPSQQHEDLN